MVYCVMVCDVNMVVLIDVVDRVWYEGMVWCCGKGVYGVM